MIKDNCGKVHYGIMILILAAIAVIMTGLIENRYILYRRDSISDGILLSNLAACIAKSELFVDSMNIVKDENGVYDVKSMVHDAILYIDKNAAMDRFKTISQENADLYGDGFIIEKFVVYNIKKDGCVISEYTGNTWNEYISYGDAVTDNDVSMTRSGVYARISVLIDGMITGKRRVSIENSVMLELNEDLQ